MWFSFVKIGKKNLKTRLISTKEFFECHIYLHIKLREGDI